MFYDFFMHVCHCFAHIYLSGLSLVLPPAYPPLCWFSFSVIIIKHQSQKQLGRNGLVGLRVLITIHHRGKSDRNLRQELGCWAS